MLLFMERELRHRTLGPSVQASDLCRTDALHHSNPALLGSTPDGRTLIVWHEPGKWISAAAPYTFITSVPGTRRAISSCIFPTCASLGRALRPPQANTSDAAWDRPVAVHRDAGALPARARHSHHSAVTRSAWLTREHAAHSRLPLGSRQVGSFGLGTQLFYQASSRILAVVLMISNRTPVCNFPDRKRGGNHFCLALEAEMQTSRQVAGRISLRSDLAKGGRSGRNVWPTHLCMIERIECIDARRQDEPLKHHKIF